MITFPTDKLQKVLLGGKCEQRNLPSGYTQVEYLESSGTQYIDTGIVPTSTLLRIKTKFQKVDTTFSGTYFGSVADPAPRNGFRIYNSAVNGKACLQTGSSLIEVNTSVDDVLDCDISIKHNEYIDYKINSISDKVTDTRVNLTNPYSIILFGTIIGTRIDRKPFRFWSFYIEKEGAVVSNLIPCRRNSDSVLGMYDTVTGNFLTNAGTGTFTAGADVTAPSPNTPMDIWCNNGVVKVFAGDKFTTEGAMNDYIINTSGAIITYSNYSVTAPVFLKAGNYIATYKDDVDATNRSFRCWSYQADGTTQIAQIFSVSTSSTTLTTIPFSLAKDSIVRFSYRISFTDITCQPINPIIYTDGTQETVTDNFGNTANAEMLLAVGDYKDVQEVLSGSVTRNVGIKVLNGNEDCQAHPSLRGWFQLAVSSAYSGIAPALCTHYSYSSEQSKEGVFFTTGRSDITSRRIVIADNVNFPNTGMLAEFKQYLADKYNAGTPIIIVYRLINPTIEQVTPQPLAGNSVTVTAGSIDNLPIESSTIAELKKRFIGDKEVKRVYIGDNLVYNNQ